MPKQRFQWERDAPDDPDADLPAVGPDREGRGGTRRKREADAVFALAKRLVAMPSHEWEHLPVSDELREHLAIAQGLANRARHRNGYRRQLLAVAGVLRKEDPAAVTAALDGDLGATPKDRALMEVEVWRTRILEQGDPAIDALLDAHPRANRKRIRDLARQARKDHDAATQEAEAKGEAPPPHSGRAYKTLFATLRTAMDV